MRESAVRKHVTVPALILGAAALLWGWHQSVLPYAVFAAIAVESARAVRFRWAFDDSDFHRLGDVTAVGLLLLVVVQFTDRGMTGIYGVLRWFPLVILGLTLAQLYSTRAATPLSAMFLSVRIALKRGRMSQPGELDMRLPFLIACMLSASAGSTRSGWILPAEAALLLWLLWANRPPRRSILSVVVALSLCVGVAAGAAGVVSATRAALGPVIMDIMRERMAHWRDPFRNHTALGEIGRLKESDRIVMRIESPPGIPVPQLLHEATYSNLSNNVWLAGASPFAALQPGADGTRWDLSADRRPFSTVTIAKNLINNKALLAVPAGAFRLEELPVEELQANSLGALKVENGPALIRYRVRYAPGAGFRAQPRDNDLSVPQRLQPVMQRTLDSLGIAQTSAAGADNTAVVGAIARHFADSFSYTLDLTRSAEQLHPIEDFLQRTRAGHCEYFATATVLLLRAAGIPARYATGFAVQEYSPLEEAWLVRRRHSHSWAVAWLNGQWVAVDTTPVQWFAAEAQGAPWWQPTYDAVSWLWHRFSRWRLESTGEETQSDVLLWALLPLSLFLGWRIARSRRVNRDQRDRGASLHAARLFKRGTDSELYRIETLLAESGLRRPAHCSMRRWLAQLAAQDRLPAGAGDWETLVALHYRLRFAANGLDAQQRQTLADGVSRWLQAATAAARPSAAPRH